MCTPMACTLMLSRHFPIVCGGTGDITLMAGGAVIPTMIGDGTAGIARIGISASVGEVGTETVGGDTIITIILIMAAGIMEAAIGEAATVGTAEASIPIAVRQARLMSIGMASARLVVLLKS